MVKDEVVKRVIEAPLDKNVKNNNSNSEYNFNIMETAEMNVMSNLLVKKYIPGEKRKNIPKNLFFLMQKECKQWKSEGN